MSNNVPFPAQAAPSLSIPCTFASSRAGDTRPSIGSAAPSFHAFALHSRGTAVPPQVNVATVNTLHPSHCPWAPTPECKLRLVPEEDFQRHIKYDDSRKRQSGGFGTVRWGRFPNPETNVLEPVCVKTDVILAHAAGLENDIPDGSNDIPDAVKVERSLRLAAQDLLTANRCHGLPQTMQYLAVVVAPQRGGAGDKSLLPVRIVMPDYGPMTLRKWMKEYPKDLPRACALLRSACEGLAALHNNGIAHLDIKPENIVVNHDRTAVTIVDFGLAVNAIEGKLVHRGGTEDYMAPETEAPLNHFAAPNDLWAMGLIAAELVCLATDQTTHAQIAAVVSSLTDVSPESSVVPSRLEFEPLVELLRRVATRALRTDATQRCSAADLVVIFGPVDIDTVSRDSERIIKDALARGLITPCETIAEKLLMISKDTSFKHAALAILRRAVEMPSLSKRVPWVLSWAEAMLDLQTQFHATQVGERLAQLGSDDPDAVPYRLKLLMLLSRCSLSRGRWRESLNHANGALALQPTGNEHAAAMHIKAMALANMGDIDNLRDAIGIYDQLLVEGGTPAMKHSMAQALVQVGHVDSLRRAIELYSDVISEDKEKETDFERQSGVAPGPKDPQVAATMCCKAAALMKLEDVGSLQEALQLCDEAMTIYAVTLGPRHPSYAAAKQTKAYALTKLGSDENLREAIILFNDVMSILTAALGPRHSSLFVTISGKLEALLNRGDNDSLRQALILCDEAISIGETTLGPNDIEVIGMKHSKAQVLFQICDYKSLHEALALYDEMIPISKAAPSQVAVLMLSKAEALTKLEDNHRRLQEGLKLYDDVISIQSDAFGPKHCHVAVTMRCKARALCVLGDPQSLGKAVALCDDALSIERAAPKPRQIEVAAAIHVKAEALTLLGNTDSLQEALTLFEEATTIVTSARGPKHPGRAAVLAAHAQALAKLGGVARLRQALILYDEAMSIEDAVLTPRHPNRLLTMFGKLRVLTKLTALGDTESKQKALELVTFLQAVVKELKEGQEKEKETRRAV